MHVTLVKMCQFGQQYHICISVQGQIRGGGFGSEAPFLFGLYLAIIILKITINFGFNMVYMITNNTNTPYYHRIHAKGLAKGPRSALKMKKLRYSNRAVINYSNRTFSISSVMEIYLYL